MHSKHAVAPLALMNVPAAQLVHEPCPAVGCTVPGLHCVGSAAPVEQKAPAGHSTQSSSLVIERLSAAIVPFWWRPDGHGSDAEAPAAQYEPAGQTSHAVCPLAPWKVPAGQSVVSDALRRQKPPRLHGRGCEAPPAQK